MPKVIPEPSATTSPPPIDVEGGSEVEGEEAAKASGESKPPRYWQAILGDICQLPGFPRATGDPKRYLECVRQNLAEDRKDLGVWTLRECVEGFQFVAAARRCKNVRSIRRQEAICAGSMSTEYDFCPAESADEFEIHETRAAPRRCACPDGQVDCLCARPEVLEPVKIARRTRTTQPAVLFADQQQAEEAEGQEEDGSQGMTPALRFQSFQTNGGPSRCQQRCGSGGTTTSACTCPTTIRQCQMTTTQQQYCPRRDQQAVIQPQPCALVKGSAQNARYQGICSWMLDPLACDPDSRCHFLQCQPAANNLFCGRWQRMPCAPATIFDPVAQVCVWDNAATPAPLPLPTPAPPSGTPQSPPGVQFGNPPAVIPTLSAAVGRPFGQNGGFNANGASATSFGDAQSAFNNHNNFLGGGGAFGQQSNGFAGFSSDSNQNGGGFSQSTSFFPSAAGGFNGNSLYGPSGTSGGMFENQFGGNGAFGGASGPCCSTTQPQQNLCRGGVQIGSCSSTFQCPGQSVCQIGQFSNSRPCFVCCHYKNMLMD
ncbi:hypothetical protein M3Y99_01149000 [Aphelenchoides fujianensis]|nr:hypothetical protein M3Y99_01149000 [Aphelenchoides fujianensis]